MRVVLRAGDYVGARVSFNGIPGTIVGIIGDPNATCNSTIPNFVIQPDGANTTVSWMFNGTIQTHDQKNGTILSSFVTIGADSEIHSTIAALVDGHTRVYASSYRQGARCEVILVPQPSGGIQAECRQVNCNGTCEIQGSLESGFTCECVA